MSAYAIEKLIKIDKNCWDPVYFMCYPVTPPKPVEGFVSNL